MLNRTNFESHYNASSEAKHFLFDHFSTLEKGRTYRVYFEETQETFDDMKLFKFENIVEQ